MTAHVFDSAIALTGDGHAFSGHTHPAYANMVGPFGGMISAVLLNAVLKDAQRLGEPVSLTVHYAAPIADGAFGIHTRVMRTNRTTQHWFVELVQEDAVAAFATVVTATRRDTWSAAEAAFPSVPEAASVAVAPAVPRAAWTASYEMRFIDGALTMEGAEREDSLTRLWIRDQPPRPLDYASLSAICDAFFPRLFVRRPKWVAVGTVTLTTYFHADVAELAAVGTAPVLGIAQAKRFEQGFFDQTAEIWSDEGRLLAATHQLVYFKE